MGCVPSDVCAHMVIPTEESTRVSSSTAIAYASVSPPAPPTSSGNGMPMSPSSPSLATISYGKRFSRSSASATGATSPSAKSRTVRRISSWSGERSKSMPVILAAGGAAEPSGLVDCASMNGLEALAITGAGAVAGAVNAVVGSGSLVTFPTLVALGYPSVTANVSNTVGLVPGGVSGVVGYRRELEGQWRRAGTLAIGTAIGAVIGGVLLLKLPSSVFDA